MRILSFLIRTAELWLRLYFGEISAGCTFVIFHSHKPTGSMKPLYQLAAIFAGKKKYNNNVKSKTFENKVEHGKQYR